MNKKTVKELVNRTNAIARAVGAISATLDTIYTILANAESADCGRRGRRGRCGQSGHGGQGAGAEAAAQEPERLPDVPDWRDNANLSDRSDKSDRSDRRGTDGAAQFAEEDELTHIRLIVAAHQGESLAKIIGAIQKETGLNSRELAGVLGVNQARISEALHGKARPSFKKIFTKILGCDGGAVSAGKRGAK